MGFWFGLVWLFVLQKFKITRRVKWVPVCPWYRCGSWRWSAGFHWACEFLSKAPDYLHQNHPQTPPFGTSRQAGTLPCVPSPVLLIVNLHEPSCAPHSSSGICSFVPEFFASPSSREWSEYSAHYTISLHFTFEKQTQTGRTSPFSCSDITLLHVAAKRDACSNLTDLQVKIKPHVKGLAKFLILTFNLWFTFKVGRIALGLCLT